MEGMRRKDRKKNRGQDQEVQFRAQWHSRIPSAMQLTSYPATLAAPHLLPEHCRRGVTCPEIGGESLCIVLGTDDPESSRGAELASRLHQGRQGLP